MKFSITIPAFKRTYLKECIDSCLAQTYQDFEVIIVNDASPEDLDSIISLYDDKRIRYYKNERNHGAYYVVKNWNKCLEYATGDYIICMGDDDRLLPCCLNEYAKLISEYPELKVFHGWTEIIDENSQFVSFQYPRPIWESVYGLIWSRWKYRHDQYIGDFLFKIDDLRKEGGFYMLPLAWGSDDITVVRAACNLGIANTQTPCFQYRRNRQTISSTGNALVKIDAICQEQKWYQSFLVKEPTDEMDKRYFRLINRIENTFFQRKKEVIVAQDIYDHGIYRIICWINKRKQYGLCVKRIIRGYIRLFIHKRCK